MEQASRCEFTAAGISQLTGSRLRLGLLIMKTLSCLVLVVSLTLVGAGCLHRSRAPEERIASPVPHEECAKPLSQSQLRQILESAIRVAGGDPSHLDARYKISTSPQECDYLVSAVSLTTTNHYSLLISRSGEIKTWPWCCEPAFFVPPVGGQKE